MSTANAIQMPANLFKKIDKAYAESCDIFGEIDKQALNLISWSRDKKEVSKTSTIRPK